MLCNNLQRRIHLRKELRCISSTKMCKFPNKSMSTCKLCGFIKTMKSVFRFNIRHLTITMLIEYSMMHDRYYIINRSWVNWNHWLAMTNAESPHWFLYARLQTEHIMLWRCSSGVQCPAEFVRAITPDPLCRFEQYFTWLLPWT
jgi:hypothetical protein